MTKAQQARLVAWGMQFVWQQAGLRLDHGTFT
jgi:hypothetical protein